MSKLIKLFDAKTVVKLIRFWPPYLASGISVSKVNDNMTEIEVKMKQRFYNTNYVGTHFGGSLFSMCDPFYMFMLLHHLHKDHIVWDQSASIQFIKPGKGTVRVLFKISLDEIEEIKSKCLTQYKYQPEYEADILDEKNNIVAKIKKKLYVRRKSERLKTKKDE